MAAADSGVAGAVAQRRHSGGRRLTSVDVQSRLAVCSLRSSHTSQHSAREYGGGRALHSSAQSRFPRARAHRAHASPASAPAGPSPGAGRGLLRGGASAQGGGGDGRRRLWRRGRRCCLTWSVARLLRALPPPQPVEHEGALGHGGCAAVCGPRELPAPLDARRRRRRPSRRHSVPRPPARPTARRLSGRRGRSCLGCRTWIRAWMRWMRSSERDLACIGALEAEWRRLGAPAQPPGHVPGSAASPPPSAAPPPATGRPCNCRRKKGDKAVDDAKQVGGRERKGGRPAW